jgi:hypothetical protein
MGGIDQMTWMVTGGFSINPVAKDPHLETAMRVLYKLAGTMLFALAIMLVSIGSGLIGADPSEASILDSPEASGRIAAMAIPALLLCAGGAWLWQRPKREDSPA